MYSSVQQMLCFLSIKKSKLQDKEDCAGIFLVPKTHQKDLHSQWRVEAGEGRRDGAGARDTGVWGSAGTPQSEGDCSRKTRHA